MLLINNMGCCISAGAPLDDNIKEDSLNIHGKHVGSLEEFKIMEEMFVQTNKGNPFSVYDNLKLMGEGTFGKVYKIIHKETKQIRAVKVIDLTKSSIGKDSEGYRAEFLKLVKTAKLLDKTSERMVVKGEK